MPIDVSLLTSLHISIPVPAGWIVAALDIHDPETPREADRYDNYGHEGYGVECAYNIAPRLGPAQSS